MSAPREIQDLVSDVAHLYPAAQFEFDPLPSGVCFFWASLNGRNFVIEYHPRGETGVSENFPDTPPFVGHDNTYTSLKEAAARFKALLTDADHHPASAMHAVTLRDKPISS